MSDVEKIKHYAEKLIEVLEKKDMDEFLDEDAERIYGDYGYGQEDEPEPVEDTEVKHTFKVGDRVVLYKGSEIEMTGTVKRLPTEGYQGREFYIIELDLEGEGWGANRHTHGVDCDNAWYTTEDNLTLLEPEPVSEHKFKVGDHVEVTWLGSKETGVIVRTPTKQYSYKNSYLICLDKHNKGWTATKDEEGIDAENVWQIKESGIKVLQEEPKKTLEPNKWYNAKDFTVEELKELLPVGTVVIVTEKPDGNRIVNLPYERLLSTTVSNIGRNELKNSTRVGISADIWWRSYFKIEG